MADRRAKVTKRRSLGRRAGREEQPARQVEPEASSTDQPANLPEAPVPEPAAEAPRTSRKATDPSPNPANSLETLLEEERVNLMQVFGILRCLYEVLLYADDDDSTLHADVAHTCANLIDDCVGRLEAVVRRYKAGEFFASSEGPTASLDEERSPNVPDRADEAAEGE